MDNSPHNPKSKLPSDATPIAMLTVADLRAVIRAEIAAPVESSGPEYITAEQALERFGMGRAALIAKGIPRTRMGRACRYSVADIEAAIAEHRIKPRARCIKVTPVDGGDELDALIASGAVRR